MCAEGVFGHSHCVCVPRVFLGRVVVSVTDG